MNDKDQDDIEKALEAISLSSLDTVLIFERFIDGYEKEYGTNQFVITSRKAIADAKRYY